MKLFEKFTLQRPDHIGYSSIALSKISKLALVGYISKGAYSPLRAFFMRKISMLQHLYGEAGEGHLRMCRSLVYLSTNPFQLRLQNHLVVIDEAPKHIGAHSS